MYAYVLIDGTQRTTMNAHSPPLLHRRSPSKVIFAGCPPPFLSGGSIIFARCSENAPPLHMPLLWYGSRLLCYIFRGAAHRPWWPLGIHIMSMFIVAYLMSGATWGGEAVVLVLFLFGRLFHRYNPNRSILIHHIVLTIFGLCWTFQSHKIFQLFQLSLRRHSDNLFIYFWFDILFLLEILY